MSRLFKRYALSSYVLWYFHHFGLLTSPDTSPTIPSCYLTLIHGNYFSYRITATRIFLDFCRTSDKEEGVRSCSHIVISPVAPLTGFRRGQQQSLPWRPQARDIIVSNWVSWIELLWLAFRYAFTCSVVDNTWYEYSIALTQFLCSLSPILFRPHLLHLNLPPPSHTLLEGGQALALRMYNPRVGLQTPESALSDLEKSLFSPLFDPLDKFPHLEARRGTHLCDL